MQFSQEIQFGATRFFQNEEKLPAKFFSIFPEHRLTAGGK